MLKEILGTAGTGKTYTIRNMILNKASNGKKCMLIVPEQYSYESEKTLQSVLGPALSKYVEILSFKRLSNNILSSFPGYQNQQLDQSGKLLAMSVALLQLSDSLSFYSSKIHNGSFAFELVSVSDELKNAGVSPDELRSLAEQTSMRSMRDKFSELALISDCFNSIVAETGFDPSDEILRACKILDSHPDYFRGVNVFIDSFSGFTFAESLMTERILASADSVTAAFECESLNDGKNSIFAEPSRSAAHLVSICKRLSVPAAVPTVLKEQKRFHGEDLAFLEKNVMRMRPCKFQKTLPQSSISIHNCPNIYSEAEFICENIIDLVRNKGLRYRDIAVISRAHETYADPLFTAFEKYGIPFFDDRRIPAASKPLFSLILSAAQIVCFGFNTESVLRLIKTGFFDFSDSDIGELENYCYIWNIDGKAWLSPFSGNPKGFEVMSEKDSENLEKLNGMRKKIVAPLYDFKNAVTGGNGETFAAGIYNYLERIGAKNSCIKLMETFSGMGERKLADEFPAVWDIAVRALDQFAFALKNVSAPPDKMYELLYSVIAHLDIADIPHYVDEIVCGSADRIRPGEIKAAFVIGLNEGVFPPKQSDSGVFSGVDRDFLVRHGFQITPSAQQKMQTERFYLYKALTIPSDLLYLSFSKYDIDGSVLRPSFIIDEICRCFPNLETSEFVKDSENSICNDKTAFYLYSSIRNSKTELAASLKEYLLNTDFRNRVISFSYDNDPAAFELKDPSVPKALIGRKLYLSPSNIDRFHECKFRYFCQDMMKIRTLNKADMSYLEIGKLIHFYLETLLKKYGVEELISLEKSAIAADIERLSEEYFNSKMGGDFNKSERFKYFYNNISDTVFNIISRLIAEFSQCKFIPVDFELTIGDSSNDIPSIKLFAKDGTPVIVRGTVDRVDVFEQNGDKYVRIVDYKSGAKKFSLEDVYYGLNLQMLVYMFSICETSNPKYKNSKPAGILYMPSVNPSAVVSRTSADGEIEKGKITAYKMSGLVLNDDAIFEAMEKDVAGKFIPVSKTKSGDLAKTSSVANKTEFELLKKWIKKLLAAMADSVLDGKINAIPSGKNDICKYCDYKAICRKPPKSAPDDSETTDEKVKKENFFELINAKLNGDEIQKTEGDCENGYEKMD